MDYSKLLDRLEKEKKYKEELDKEIQAEELEFLWNGIKPLLDFICFVNYERKYKMKHIGSYYSFIRGDIPESYFRESVRHNVFTKGQFNEAFHCNPEIIDITVSRVDYFFKLNIVGINWIPSSEGTKEVKKNYSSIDDLILDISKYLAENAEIIQ
jgi:hypothetical protein